MPLGSAVSTRQTGVQQKVKILLVDDRPANLMALETILEDLGQDLVKATSGKEALRHVLQQRVARCSRQRAQPLLATCRAEDAELEEEDALEALEKARKALANSVRS